jgi:hypothetical protein
MDEMQKLMVGPGAMHQEAWQGVIRRLEKAGVRVSIAELLAAPFRLDVDPHLNSTLTA